MDASMVPGMEHCGFGDGPGEFDPLTVLEQWVEKGKAPDRIIASRIRGRKTERTGTTVSLPTGGDVQGNGEHGRRCELLVFGPKIEGANSLITAGKLLLVRRVRKCSKASQRGRIR